MDWLKVLARFFLLGALWLGIQQLAHTALQPEPALLVVRVRVDASTEAEPRAIAEAVLLNRAVAQRLHQHDPVVRERLVRNMRFAEPETRDDDGTLLKAAIDLGMHLSDSVARGRLLDAMRAELLRAAPLPAPDDEDLRAYMQSHPERYRRPATVSFAQVFLSRQRRGERLEEDAKQLGERLAGSVTPVKDAGSMSDPGLLPLHFGGSERRIDGRFGPGFGQSVAKLPVHSWQGPLPSSFGLHFVWVQEREEGGLPELAAVRSRVAEHWQVEKREAHVIGLAMRLADGYRVEVRRGP